MLSRHTCQWHPDAGPSVRRPWVGHSRRSPGTGCRLRWQTFGAPRPATWCRTGPCEPRARAPSSRWWRYLTSSDVFWVNGGRDTTCSRHERKWQTERWLNECYNTAAAKHSAPTHTAKAHKREERKIRFLRPCVEDGFRLPKKDFPQIPVKLPVQILCVHLDSLRFFELLSLANDADSTATVLPLRTFNEVVFCLCTSIFSLVVITACYLENRTGRAPSSLQQAQPPACTHPVSINALFAAYYHCNANNIKLKATTHHND